MNRQASVGRWPQTGVGVILLGLAVEEDAGAHAVVEKEATSMHRRCSLQIKGMTESFDWLEGIWRLLKEASLIDEISKSHRPVSASVKPYGSVGKHPGQALRDDR